MNQPTTINKVITELEHDFFLSPEFKERLEYYLALTYGAGFDYGKKPIGNSQPVGYYKEDKFVIYPNTAMAERDLGITRTLISKSIIRKTKCAGFMWYYITLKNAKLWIV